jgi:ferredoxin-NADP reductase/ferredoxin
VLEEGDIGAGDKIVKVADGPEHVTVAEVDALLYLPSHARDQLQRALRVPSLSEGWKGSLKALLEAGDQGGNAGLAAATPPPAWTGFRTLRVAEVKQESNHVRSFVLEAEDRGPLPVAQAGQFLVFRIHPRGQSSPIIRSYSMSGPPGVGTYRISVKRDHGPGSQYFHDSVRVGDSLQVSAPRGSFTLVQSDRPVVLLSAGIGATPVLSMLHELVRSAESAREIWWCHGARNGREHPFADEVREALKSYPKGCSFVVYSAPEERDQLGVDYGAVGHLTLPSSQEIGVPHEADFYLCGPARFLEDISAALKAWEIPGSRIHSEAFGSGPAMTPGIADGPTTTPHAPAGDAGTGPEVSFIRSGIAVPWNARFGSLLEFAEACDVPVRWSCRVGVCHNCQTGTISGSVKYDPEPLDRPGEGDVLICCATPLSKIELDL